MDTDVCSEPALRSNESTADRNGHKLASLEKIHAAIALLNIVVTEFSGSEDAAPRAAASFSISTNDFSTKESFLSEEKHMTRPRSAPLVNKAQDELERSLSLPPTLMESMFSKPEVTSIESQSSASLQTRLQTVDSDGLLPAWQNLDRNKVFESYYQKNQPGMLSNGSRQSAISLVLSRSTRQTIRHPSIPSISTADGSIRWIIHPQSSSRIGWDILSAASIMLDLLALPLLTFDSEAVQSLLSITNVYAAVFWTIDLLLSFRTGYFVAAYVELRPGMIAKHYARSWLLPDLCIVVFLWISVLATQLPNDTQITARLGRVRAVAKLMGSVRTHRLLLYLSTLEAGLRSYTVQMSFSLCKIVLVLAMVVHYLACGWHLVGSEEDGWVNSERAPDGDQRGFVFLYLTATRWTLAQIKGRTDINDQRCLLERCYTIFVAFSSFVFLSLVTSGLTTTMVQLKTHYSQTQRRIRLLNSYVATHNLSFGFVYFARKSLQEAAQIQNNENDESAIFKYLPRHLQSDLVYELRGPTIAKHQLMKDLDTNFTAVFRQLLERGVSNVYATNMELVFELAAPCKRLLYHSRGDLCYTRSGNVKAAMEVFARNSTHDAQAGLFGRAWLPSRDTKVQQLLDHGLGVEVPAYSCLSEAACWVKWNHKGSLVAVSMSHLFGLDVDKLVNLLREDDAAMLRGGVYALNFRMKQRHIDVLDLMDRDFGTLLSTWDTKRVHHSKKDSNNPRYKASGAAVVPTECGGSNLCVPRATRCAGTISMNQRID